MLRPRACAEACKSRRGRRGRASRSGCGCAGACDLDLVKEADVNLAQGILTIAFLIAFVTTMIWCPWHCGSWHVYSPFWTPPPCDYAVNDIFWSQLLIEWVGLAVIYAGLRAVLK